MKIIRIVIVLVLVFILFFMVKWAVMPDLAPDWTGFGPYNEKELGPRSKTLWDWLDLLIIPIVLTIIAWLFKEFEKVKSDEKEKSAHQSATCDNFIKIITELNLNHGLATHNPKQGADKIARSRVNFVLNILDGDRKGLVLQFLYESELIKMGYVIVSRKELSLWNGLP